MDTVIIELDQEKLASGFVTVTKVNSKGRRKGQMDLESFADLMRDVFQWDASRREIRLVSRFETKKSPYLAWGQNGAKWVVVKELPPAEYYLVSAAGQAYPVHLPRLVVKASNYGVPRIFWTADVKLKLTTRIYPLMIGNIDSFGRVCLGTTGLKCQAPEDIDQYVRRIIEAPADDHYLSRGTNVDKLYAALSRQWAPGIGRKHGTTLGKLIAATDRPWG